MKLGIRMAPSRVGKRQVIGYLPAHQIEAVYAMAAATYKTNQEIICEIINAALIHHGEEPFAIPQHTRVFRRGPHNRANERNAEQGAPKCRVGKRALSGWFVAESVIGLAATAVKLDTSIQKLMEEGVELLCGGNILEVQSEPMSVPSMDSNSDDGLPSMEELADLDF